MNPRIDRLQRRSASDDRVIALAGGLPSEATFPKGALARALSRALAGSSGALQYGWPEGRDGLRAWVARYLAARGAQVDADDVIVTSGAQQALAIAAQLLGSRGDHVLVDAETYPAALDLFRTRGLVPTTAARRARVVYVMPQIANPRGSPSALSLPAGVPIIEDDAYADLRFDGPPGAPLLVRGSDRVLHVGTFSKTLCPGLRVGWLVVPKRLRRRALLVKHAIDLQANSLAQAVLEEYLARADWEARLERLRAFYARRASTLAGALRKHLPAWRFELPRGGFSIWAETGEPGDDAELLAIAIANGTSFDPGRDFRASDRSSPIAMRLAFSSTPRAKIDEGVRRLARAWNEYRRARDRSSRRAG